MFEIGKKMRDIKLKKHLSILFIFVSSFIVSAQDLEPRFLSSVSAPNKNNQRNSKYGGTISYKIGKQSSLKLAITDGLFTYSQADFTTFLVGYSVVWFDKLK